MNLGAIFPYISLILCCFRLLCSDVRVPWGDAFGWCGDMAPLQLERSAWYLAPEHLQRQLRAHIRPMLP